MAAKVIAIANQKGGCGKTTSAINIADGLRHKGYKVLLWDLDPQCNSTSHYGAKTTDTVTTLDIFNGESTAVDAIQHTDKGDIIPCDKGLVGRDMEFSAKTGGQIIVKNKIKPLLDVYDFIIFDTPPNVGVFFSNAILAADGVVIPITPDKYAIDGVGDILDTVNQAKEIANPDLINYGILYTGMNKSKNIDREIAEGLPKMAKALNFKLFPYVGVCQEINDAKKNCVSLFDKYPKSKAVTDYKDIVKVLLKEVKKNVT